MRVGQCLLLFELPFAPSKLLLELLDPIYALLYAMVGHMFIGQKGHDLGLVYSGRWWWNSSRIDG